MGDTVRWLDREQQSAWRGLLMGFALLQDRLEADLRQGFGISMPEYELLVRLSEQPDDSMRMAQLADAMAHSRSRATHTVRRLEEVGLVRRTQSADDRRGVVCAMTPEGRRLLERMAPVHVAGVRAHLVDLVDPADFAAVGRVMNTVADHLVGAHPEREIRLSRQ